MYCGRAFCGRYRARLIESKYPRGSGQDSLCQIFKIKAFKSVNSRRLSVLVPSVMLMLYNPSYPSKYQI